MFSLITAPILKVTTISRLLNVREDQQTLCCGFMNFLTRSSRKSTERLKNMCFTKSFSSSLPVKITKAVTLVREPRKVCLKATHSERA
jgi:hypothetical protein